MASSITPTNGEEPVQMDSTDRRGSFSIDVAGLGESLIGIKAEAPTSV
jgi:hypothetical protein